MPTTANHTTAFFVNDSGAVTVDWVVLTAALVGLGLATMAVVSQGVENVSGDVDGQLKSDAIIFSSFEDPFSFTAFDQSNYDDSYNYIMENDVSDAQISDDYVTEINKARNAIAEGNPEAAEEHLDRMAAYIDSAAAKGLTISPEHDSLETLYAEYEAAL